MTTYEVLDRIADSINPVLGLATLAWAWVARWRSPASALIANAATLLAVAVVYGIKALDGSFGLWQSAGLDYSTHAAVHVALVVSLWWISRLAGVVGMVIAVAYFALMLFQRYHNVGDLISTALVIAATSMLVWTLVRKAGGTGGRR